MKWHWLDVPMGRVRGWVNLRLINLWWLDLGSVLNLVNCASAHGPFPFSVTAILVVGLHDLFGW